MAERQAFNLRAAFGGESIQRYEHMLVSIYVRYVLKKMRWDFCKCRIANGALFALFHNDLNEEQSKAVSKRDTRADCRSSPVH